jgi:hypothetical protein
MVNDADGKSSGGEHNRRLEGPQRNSFLNTRGFWAADGENSEPGKSESKQAQAT